MRQTFAWTFALFFLGSLVVPTTALSADTRCFTREECQRVRGDIILDGKPGEDGFYTGTDAQIACGVAENKGKNAIGVEYGFCLPVSNSVTKISFGGKQSFANFGEFIQYIYKYGMWLAGITAVGLIIISGFQWAASGGNSDMIGSAKNRISGAVTGLVLLALAYTILNTINPYLVQLRLPQTWMINEIGLAPPYCELVKDKKLAKLGPSDPPPTEAQAEAALTEAKNSGYTIEPAVAACGNEYLVDGTGKLSCTGRMCPEQEVCSPESVTMGSSINTLVKKTGCLYGQMAFHLSISKDLFTRAKQIAGSELSGIKWFLNRVNADGTWADYDDVWAIPMCKTLGGSNILEGAEVNLDDTFNNQSQAWGIMNVLQASPNKLETEEYMVRVGRLNLDPTSACDSIPKWLGKAELVGYIIRIELDQEADSDDLALYIGYSGNGIKYNSKKKLDLAQNYIPVDVIKRGITGNIQITNPIIDALIEESD